jgi:hypothetical protein
MQRGQRAAPSGHVNSILTKATTRAHLVEGAAVTVYTRTKVSASALYAIHMLWAYCPEDGRKSRHPPWQWRPFSVCEGCQNSTTHSNWVLTDVPGLPTGQATCPPCWALEKAPKGLSRKCHRPTNVRSNQ